MHIIDEGTRFITTVLLNNMETKAIWNALICCWISIFTELQIGIKVDQDRNVGDYFNSLAEMDWRKVEKQESKPIMGFQFVNGTINQYKK